MTFQCTSHCSPSSPWRCLRAWAHPGAPTPRDPNTSPPTTAAWPGLAQKAPTDSSQPPRCLRAIQAIQLQAPHGTSPWAGCRTRGDEAVRHADLDTVGGRHRPPTRALEGGEWTRANKRTTRWGAQNHTARKPVALAGAAGLLTSACPLQGVDWRSGLGEACRPLPQTDWSFPAGSAPHRARTRVHAKARCIAPDCRPTVNGCVPARRDRSATCSDMGGPAREA